MAIQGGQDKGRGSVFICGVDVHMEGRRLLLHQQRNLPLAIWALLTSLDQLSGEKTLKARLTPQDVLGRREGGKEGGSEGGMGEKEGGMEGGRE